MNAYYGPTFTVPGSENANAAVRNAERWLMEEYGTILDFIQTASWLVVVTIGFALIAHLAMQRRWKTNSKATVS